MKIEHIIPAPKSRKADINWLISNGFEIECLVWPGLQRPWNQKRRSLSSSPKYNMIVIIIFSIWQFWFSSKVFHRTYHYFWTPTSSCWTCQSSESSGEKPVHSLCLNTKSQRWPTCNLDLDWPYNREQPSRRQKRRAGRTWQPQLLIEIESLITCRLIEEAQS